jgi:hypothetical protein
LKFVLVGDDVALVVGGVVGGEQDGDTGEPGFHSIQRRFAFSVFSARAGAQKRIRTIGGEAVGHGQIVSRKENGPRQEEPVASLVERSTWNGENELEAPWNKA